jgi:hypothetical protein
MIKNCPFTVMRESEVARTSEKQMTSAIIVLLMWAGFVQKEFSTIYFINVRAVIFQIMKNIKQWVYLTSMSCPNKVNISTITFFFC